MEIIPNKEQVSINAISLAVKSLKIVDWKIYKEGKKSYYHIIRADGKTKMYMVFSKMHESFNREDLEDLYKLVTAKFKSTRLMEDLDLLLWGDLKIMFEPHVKDAIWKKQQGYKVLEWKLYDSCGVHSLRMQSMQVFMLVEKTYPLTPPTLTMMLEKKLQMDFNEKYAKCLMLLVEVKTASTKVNVADEVSAAQELQENILSSYYCWKKVLNFCPISSHRGVDIGKAVEMCLLKWGIESNVFTIILDNASANDVAVEYLKIKFPN
nr:zinc finger BED domain-containing protein RICESLEEPER 2-like [Tanacetum cinerariifolium]